MAADERNIDLLTLTPRERDVWDAAYLSAYLAGHEAGATWADERAATLFQNAVAIVHRMAGMPEVDPEDSRRRAAARARRWVL